MSRRPRGRAAAIPAIDLALLALSVPVAFSGAMYAPAYGAWIADFGTGGAHSVAALWTLAMPALWIALGVPLFQRMEEELGVVRMLGVGCALVFLSGAVGFLAEDVAMLLLSRSIVGIGAAALLVSTTTILAKRHVGSDRKVWLSRQAGVMTFAGVLGVVLVGVLSQEDWRLSLLLPAVALPAYGLALWLSLRAPTLWKPRYFVEAEHLSIGAPPLAVVPLVHTPATRGRMDARTPWRLIAFGVTGGALLMLYFAAVQLLCTHVAREFELDAFALSGLLACLMGGAGLSRWQASRLPRAFGHPRSLAIGFLLAALGLATASRSASPLLMSAPLFLAGVGFGAIRPVLGWWMNRVTEESRRARSLARISAAYYVGISLSPLFVLLVQDWRRLWGGLAAVLLVWALVAFVLSFRAGWSEADAL